MMLPSGNDAAFTLGEYFGEFIRTENFKLYDKLVINSRVMKVSETTLHAVSCEPTFFSVHPLSLFFL